MSITFLHTADVHVPTFDQLLDREGYQGPRRHVVRPELLERAISHGIDSVRADTQEIVGGLSSASAVLCTCSTLGPLIDEISDPKVLRIDRPAMMAACKSGKRVLVAACLDGTLAPSLALLADCAQKQDVSVVAQHVICDEAWALFEAGDHEGYATTIARCIIAELEETPADCVVLAQASMMPASRLLDNLLIPVLATPPLAVRSAIRMSSA